MSERTTLWGMIAVALVVWLAAVVWPGDQWWLIGFSGVLVAWSVFHLMTDARS